MCRDSVNTIQISNNTRNYAEKIPEYQFRAINVAARQLRDNYFGAGVSVYIIRVRVRIRVKVRQPRGRQLSLLSRQWL